MFTSSGGGQLPSKRMQGSIFQGSDGGPSAQMGGVGINEEGCCLVIYLFADTIDASHSAYSLPQIPLVYTSEKKRDYLDWCLNVCICFPLKNTTVVF